VSDFPTDSEIAGRADIRPITEIAGKLGLSPEDLDLYGENKAKVHLDALGKRGKGAGEQKETGSG